MCLDSTYGFTDLVTGLGKKFVSFDMFFFVLSPNLQVCWLLRLGQFVCYSPWTGFRLVECRVFDGLRLMLVIEA